MGILDGLEPIQHREPCRVGKIILELKPDDQQILLEALSDDRWTARSLMTALNARGISIARDTIHSHMKRTCRCSKI